jgi:hypothetical protein
MQRDPEIGTRLAKLVPLLSSNYPGEVAATAQAIERVLGSVGLDWYALADMVQAGLHAKAQPAPPPPAARARPKPPPAPAGPCRGPRAPFQQAAMEILRVSLKGLTKRENEFLVTILHWDGEPTPKQLRWLLTLAERHGVKVPHE